VSVRREEQPRDPDTAGAVAVGSCDLSDACDQLGVEAVRTGLLRPSWSECAPLAGRVRTVRLEAGTGTPLPELLEVLAGTNDRIVLVDLGGRLDVQCWGTVLATAASRFGVRGAIVNGAVRDLEGLRELGFPTFARGVYPARIRGRLRLAAVDEPVVLDGGIVESDSFVIADANGAAFLPDARAGEAIALASNRRAHEEEQLQAVRDGADPRDVFGPRAGETRQKR
jgi:4-hydroxy-4-methyl-2-oxoglutarate aldolase